MGWLDARRHTWTTIDNIQPDEQERWLTYKIAHLELRHLWYFAERVVTGHASLRSLRLHSVPLTSCDVLVVSTLANLESLILEFNYSVAGDEPSWILLWRCRNLRRVSCTQIVFAPNSLLIFAKFAEVFLRTSPYPHDCPTCQQFANILCE